MKEILHPGRLVYLAIGLGLAFTWLFFDLPLGISMLVFIVMLSVSLYALSRWEVIAVSTHNKLLLIPILFFAAMVAIRANPFLTFLNVSAVFFILCVLVYSNPLGSSARLSLGQLAVIPFVTTVQSLIVGSRLARYAAATELSPVSHGLRQNAVPLARGMLLAMPVVILFGALLVSADVVFADQISQFFDKDFLNELTSGAGRILMTLVVAWFVGGGVALSLVRVPHAGESELPAPFSLGIIEASIVLTACNVLFASFVKIQFSYLFGGHANIAVDGYTYAQYARNGFFELVIVSMLALGLLLLFKLLTRRTTVSYKLLFNALSTMLVAFLIIMLVSAFQRLQLYELTFGFTELRIYPHVFMVWLAVLLGWFIVTLWIRPKRFAIGFFVIALAYVATLNIMNVDAFIVYQNMYRYELTGDLGIESENEITGRVHSKQIDTHYLLTLSDDAVPALLTIIDGLPEHHQERLQENLIQRWQEYDENDRWRAWQSLHLARLTAYSALTEITSTTDWEVTTVYENSR